MAEVERLKANYEIYSDKSKNAVTDTRYINHKGQWLDEALGNIDPHWIGTKEEYEAQKDTIEAGTTVIITDDYSEAGTQHNDLIGRSDANAHPISAITGLQNALDGKADTFEDEYINAVTENITCENIESYLDKKIDFKGRILSLTKNIKVGTIKNAVIKTNGFTVTMNKYNTSMENCFVSGNIDSDDILLIVGNQEIKVMNCRFSTYMEIGYGVVIKPTDARGDIVYNCQLENVFFDGCDYPLYFDHTSHPITACIFNNIKFNYCKKTHICAKGNVFCSNHIFSNIIYEAGVVDSVGIDLTNFTYCIFNNVTCYNDSTGRFFALKDDRRFIDHGFDYGNIINNSSFEGDFTGASIYNNKITNVITGVGEKHGYAALLKPKNYATICEVWDAMKNDPLKSLFKFENSYISITDNTERADSFVLLNNSVLLKLVGCEYITLMFEVSNMAPQFKIGSEWENLLNYDSDVSGRTVKYKVLKVSKYLNAINNGKNLELSYRGKPDVEQRIYNCYLLPCDVTPYLYYGKNVNAIV